MPWTEPATSWPRPWTYRKTRSTWFSTPPEFAAHLQSQVTVSIGGVNVPVAYSGTQGFFTGLDQVNVQLPASLAGRGDVPVILSVAGKQANTARLTFQ